MDGWQVKQDRECSAKPKPKTLSCPLRWMSLVTRFVVLLESGCRALFNHDACHPNFNGRHGGSSKKDLDNRDLFLFVETAWVSPAFPAQGLTLGTLALLRELLMGPARPISTPRYAHSYPQNSGVFLSTSNKLTD
jgi:hypothetical protein